MGTLIYERVTETSPLPEIGQGYERAVLDLKLEGQVVKGFHLAKDVAAFANHLGGTLLIGAGEAHGRVAVYKPMVEAVVNDLQKAVSEAVRDRCSPRPFYDFVRRSRDGGWLLAVNVNPYIGQPVAVSVKCIKDHDGYGGDAFVFPVRAGVDSTYLLPEQLPMFMTPDVRKAVILLSRIPRKSRVNVNQGILGTSGAAAFIAMMGDIDQENNALTLLGCAAGPGLGLETSVRTFPLDLVRTAVKETDGWRICIHAFQ
jgi:hypothetical protein